MFQRRLTPDDFGECTGLVPALQGTTMPDDNNNCPSCNDYPMGEPLPGNPNVLVRPYAPPTDAELEFSKNFYAGMRARTGHYPGAGIPARA